MRINDCDRVWVAMRFTGFFDRERGEKIIRHIGTRAWLFLDNVEERHWVVLELVSDGYYVVEEVTRRTGLSDSLLVEKKFPDVDGRERVGYGLPVMEISSVVGRLNPFLRALYGVEIRSIDDMGKKKGGDTEGRRVAPLGIRLVRNNIVRLTYMVLLLRGAGLTPLSQLFEAYLNALLDPKNCIDLPFGSEDRFWAEYIVGWLTYYITGSFGAVRDVLEELACTYCDRILYCDIDRIIACIRAGEPWHDVFTSITGRVTAREAIRVKEEVYRMMGGVGGEQASP